MEKMCCITKLGAEGMQVYRVEKYFCQCTVHQGPGGCGLSNGSGKKNSIMR